MSKAAKNPAAEAMFLAISAKTAPRSNFLELV